LEYLHFGIDVLELGVSVGIAGAFARLRIGLQTEAQTLPTQMVRLRSALRASCSVHQSTRSPKVRALGDHPRRQQLRDRSSPDKGFTDRVGFAAEGAGLPGIPKCDALVAPWLHGSSLVRAVAA